MSVQCEVGVCAASGVPMSVFERYLSLWVGLCIAAGLIAPGLFQGIGALEVAQVNLSSAC